MPWPWKKTKTISSHDINKIFFLFSVLGREEESSSDTNR